MKKYLLILASSIVLGVSPVYADHAIPTSGDYLAYCQESVKVYEGTPADKLQAGSCLGFAEGALSMHEAYKSSDQGNPFYCVSESGISSFDAISVWIRFLENNPGKLDNAPIVTFVLSMGETYPCDQSPPVE
jgi:hypothetical protein